MQFVCRLGTADGRVVQEVHHARDEAALRGELERHGAHVFAIERRFGFALGWPGRGRRRRRLGLTQLMIFNQELAALLRAGLPLLQALNIMLERLKDPVFREVLTEVRDRVKSGEELSEAFAAFGDMFPPLYASTLKAGERTGELELVIRRFIRYLQLVINARKRVVSALVYPAVLIGLSLSMIFVMAVWVMPRFMVFYDELNVQLPLLTRMTLAFSLFVRHNGLLLALGLAIGGTFLWRWAQTSVGRVAVDRWRLRIPFLGPVLHRFALSEFCRSLATLLGGGLPLVPALEISVDAVSNAYVRKQLEPVVPQVREGKAFYAALESAETFTDMAVDMVKVGEATGALDTMLASVSDFLDEEVETSMQRILSLIEPLMLVFMGTIVALLLVSVYLPMFSMLGKIQ
jgi:type IV pilus assembly protein PilC